MTIEETYAAWRASLKSPDDSIFYYHRDLERILLGLAIFVISSRPVAAKLGKAEMLKVLHLQVPDLITYWIDGDDKGFAQLFPMVMTVAQGYSRAAVAAEHRYPSEKKAIRMMAYLLCNACGAGGDMDQALADELLDDLSTDGDDIYSDKITEYGHRLLALTRQHGVDVPFSKMADILSFKPSGSKQTASGSNSPSERNSATDGAETPAKPVSKESFDDLLSRGGGFSLDEFQEATWRKDYDDSLYRKADDVILALDMKGIKDMDLEEAAIRYDCHVGVQDVKAHRVNQMMNRQRRMVNLGNAVNSRYKGDDFSDEAMRSILIQLPLGELMAAFGSDKSAKFLAKDLHWFTDKIRQEVKTLNLTRLEVLVKTRVLCKRLPKATSEYVKGILDTEVHRASFWERIEGTDTLTGRLRKLTIQCGALKLYRYAPETSYTAAQFADILPLIRTSSDSREHALFTDLLTKYDWKNLPSGFAREYADTLSAQLDKSDAPTDIINHTYSLSLLKEKFSEASTSTSETTSAQKSQPLGRPITSEEAYALIDRHPDWGDLAAECNIAMMEGTSTVEDFCRQHRLPLEEFRPLQEHMLSMIKDMAALLNSGKLKM